MADLKANVKLMEGPLSIQRAKREVLEKHVANFDVNVMGYRNAKGSLEDI